MVTYYILGHFWYKLKHDARIEVSEIQTDIMSGNPNNNQDQDQLQQQQQQNPPEQQEDAAQQQQQVGIVEGFYTYTSWCVPATDVQFKRIFK